MLILYSKSFDYSIILGSYLEKLSKPLLMDNGRKV